jgi:hypothetical protein
VSRLIVVFGLAAGLFTSGLLAPPAERVSGPEAGTSEPASPAWSRLAPVKIEPSPGTRSDAPAVLPAASHTYEQEEIGPAPYEPPALAPLSREATPGSQRDPPVAR